MTRRADRRVSYEGIILRVFASRRVLLPDFLPLETRTNSIKGTL
jgi:hypothetical protein